MNSLNKEVREAVGQILSGSTFPVALEDDDRGLTVDSYVDFAVSVIRKMRLAD